MDTPTLSPPHLAQRGRAAISFQAGIGLASNHLMAKTEQALTQAGLTGDALPEGMEARHAKVAETVGGTTAFKLNQLLSEWRAKSHASVAYEAFAEIRAEIEPALRGLDEGPTTLDTATATAIPSYWSNTEFHRTAGGWDASDFNGYVHGEVLHKLMLAKMFPGDIFAQRRDAARHAPRQDYARILDMGASSGHYTVALSEVFPQAEISGIDLSLRMLEHARRSGNARGAAWKLSVRAAEDTGFPAESFDLVTSFNLFHELPPAGDRGGVRRGLQDSRTGRRHADVGRAALCGTRSADGLALRSHRQMGRRTILARVGVHGFGRRRQACRLRRCGCRRYRPGTDTPSLPRPGPQEAVMMDHASFAVAGDHANRRILSVSQLDQLGEALVALTGEVWILTDRLAVLEAVLANHGIDARAEVDRFVPSPEMEKALNTKRDKLIATVLAAFKTTSDQP